MRLKRSASSIPSASASRSTLPKKNALAALDRADVGAIQAGKLRQGSLGETARAFRSRHRLAANNLRAAVSGRASCTPRGYALCPIRRPVHYDYRAGRSAAGQRRLISHFQNIAPTWLLLRLAMAANEWMAPLLRHCSDIVVMPRLKLMKGTKNGGMEDHAWYRFDINHTAGPVLHNNRGRGDVIHTQRRRICEQCRKPTAAAIDIAVLLAERAGSAPIARGLALGLA